MDRRSFIGAVAGGLVTAPLVARTEAQEAVRHLGEPGRGGARATGTLHSTGGAIPATLPAIVFTKGVAKRVSLASQVPVGDRYNGGYFDRTPGYKSDDDALRGVWYDAKKGELVYDGVDPIGSTLTRNPNPQYWIGVEHGPYNAHWQWPPTPVPIPQPKAGVSQALANPQKHVCPVFCPRDSHIHLMFGDFSTYGIINDGMQSGRPVSWDWDPIANTWRLDYQPPTGVAGDVIPLFPDIMACCWLPDQQVFYIAWGRVRGGDDAAWKSIGGKADAYPSGSELAGHGGNEADPALLPNFTFDPATGKYRLVQGGSGWKQDESYHVAYDGVTKRIYNARTTNTIDGIRIHWRDSATLDTTGWKTADVPTVPGHPWPRVAEVCVHVDEVGRRLFWFDGVTPALMAITLAGHPLGEHRMQIVADLPKPALSFMEATGGFAQVSVSAWIPEKRSIVVFWEPLFHNVGPDSASFTIDVDTGAVTQGPRFPNYDNEARPWSPNLLIWYPPTQELVLGGSQTDRPAPGSVAPQTYYRYKWIDGPDASHPVSAWTFFRIDLVAVK